MRPEVLQTLCNAALDPAAHKPGDGGLALLSEGIFLGVLNPRAPLRSRRELSLQRRRSIRTQPPLCKKHSIAQTGK